MAFAHEPNRDRGTSAPRLRCFAIGGHDCHVWSIQRSHLPAEQLLLANSWKLGALMQPLLELSVCENLILGVFRSTNFGFKVTRFKVGSFQVLVQFLVLFIRWSDTLKRPNSLKEIAQQQQQCSIMIFNCHTAHTPWSMALAAEWRWRSSTLFMSFAELWKDAIFVGKETLLQLLLTN